MKMIKISGYRTTRIGHFAKAAFCVLSAISILLLHLSPACAAPVDGTVAGGSATISQSGATTTINQTSNRTIINWRGFDINANELVRFIQPGQTAIALNRITGGSPTSILGALSANGRIFIVNPNGVVFGAGARVDVAGLLATTFDIKNDDFMGGKYAFAQDPNVNPSFVVNGGEIKIADNGFCFLIAPGVKNEGQIVAQLGKVVMASGKALTIDFNGDGLLTYTVSGKVVDEIMGPDGKPFSSAVGNSGTISAQGGHVVLVGNAAQRAFSSVVNNSGIIEATSLVVNGGRVALLGGAEGIVQNTGKIDVSAAEAAARPGEVMVSGEYAGNFGTILAQGQDGSSGGTVAFNSTIHTLLGSESLIDVSGLGNSSAGSVLLRSDNHTTFNGAILARGGAAGGDGGFVDVSSLGQVDLLGSVDAAAPQGKIGTLLIDPKNIDVNNAGVAYNDNVNNKFSNNAAGNTVITATSINSQIADVVLQANTDVTVTSAITIANAGTALTLQAGRSILVNNDVTTNNGAITMTANDAAADAANRDAGVGVIAVAAGRTIASGSGNITLTVSSGASAVAGGITVDTVTSTGTVTMNAAGDLAIGNINTGTGGTVNLTATNGSITDRNVGAGAENILAGAATLATAGVNGGAIGTSAAPIRTKVEGITASTNNGGIYINETDGLIINSVIAREWTVKTLAPADRVAGVAPVVNSSGKVVLTDNKASDVAGTFDVTINAGGNVALGVVTAPNKATVKTSSGTIVDNNDTPVYSPSGDYVSMTIVNNVTARTVDLQATGAIALSDNAIEANVETTKASTAGGDIYLSLGNTGHIDSIVAGGAGKIIRVTETNGNLGLGTMTAAGGTVTVDNSSTGSGSLLDDNGAAVNITADKAVLIGKNGIGSATDAIDLAGVTDLSATATVSGKGVYVADTAALTAIAGKTYNGDAAITSTGGNLNFVASTSLLSASAASALSFENNGGDLKLDAVNAGAGTATLTASGSILYNSGVLTAATATLNAGSTIGASGASLMTAADTLNASGKGGVYASNTKALTLTASASGTGSDIDVRTAAGNLTLKSVTAADQVALTAAGSILAFDPAATVITASGATLTAGGSIVGQAAPLSPLKTKVTDMAAIAGNGALALSNSRALNLTSATATGAGLSVAAGGDLTLGTVTASGQAVTLTSSGAILDGNAGGNNITAASADLSAKSIGALTDGIETAVSTITLAGSAGGIYVQNTKPDLALLSATAAGTAADVDISNTGNIALGTINAAGHTVVLTAGGAITDANAGANNVTAQRLTITGSPISSLDLAVDQLSAVGVANGATLTNSEPLAIDYTSLEAGGTGGTMTFDAPSITVLDIPETHNHDAAFGILNGTALLAVDRSLVMRTLAGNIVFLDQTDTIQAQGTGSITIEAGTKAGSIPGNGAVAIIGNLKTANQPISVSADSHISISQLNAGTGHVAVNSLSGMIIDGNGSALNIIGGSATLSASTPSEQDANQHSIQSVADASAALAKAELSASVRDDWEKHKIADAADQVVHESTVAAAESDLAAKTSASEAADAALKPLQDADMALSIVSQVLDITNTIVGTIAAVAQAVPFTGDGGAATAAFIITATKNTVDTAQMILEMGPLAAAENAAATAATNMEHADTLLSAYRNDLTTVTSIAAGSAQSFATWSTLATKADIAHKAADQVKAQALTADKFTGDIYSANAIGTASQALGVQVPGRVDINAGASNVYLQTVGNTTLGTVTASNNKGGVGVPSVVLVTGTGDVTVAGQVSAQNRVRIDTVGAIKDGTGSIVAPEFVATATNGIGTNNWINTTVDKFAATGGAGGVAISNSKALLLTTVDGVSSITTTGGGANIKAAGALTLAMPIDASAGPQNVVLTSTTGAIIDNNTSAYDIKAAGLGMSAVTGVGAGDNPFETQVSNLAAAGGTGGVYVNNTGDLTLQAVGTALSNVASLSATGGEITVTNAGNMMISDGFVQGAGLTVNLTATGGSITEVSPGAAADIVGATINLVATGAGNTIGSAAQTLEINATTLNASTEGGSIYLNDTAGGVAVGLVTAGTGNVNLTATNGSITEAAVADGAADIVGATITLAVTGAASTIGTSTETLEIDATTLNASTAGGGIYLNDIAGGVALGLVTAGTGDVNLTATNGSITEAAVADGAADIVGATVNLAVTGAASTIGTSTETLEIDATTLNASTEGGSIYLNDTAGGVAVGLVTAGAGNVNLAATNGSITEAAGTDGAADIVAATINLAVTGAASTIGTAAETLEIDATTLNAATAGGSIYLNDIAGGVAVGLVTAGVGNVNLTATNGSITAAAAANGVADIVGATINLEATGAASTIGTAANTLEINATTLNAATAGGNVYLTDVAGGVAVGLVTAGTGNVTLSATGGSIIEAAPFDGAADIVGTTINLAVTGAASTIGTVANLLEVDAASTTLNASTQGGGIYINDTAGGVAIGQITAGTVGGTLGDVVLTATGGSIIPSGAGSGIVGAAVNLAVTGPGSTIGSGSGVLQINAQQLDVTTEGGDIYLIDKTGGKMDARLHYPLGPNLPNMMVRDNHVLGGSLINKLFQAQTVFGPYQLFYRLRYDMPMAPPYNGGTVFLVENGVRKELR